MKERITEWEEVHHSPACGAGRGRSLCRSVHKCEILVVEGRYPMSIDTLQNQSGRIANAPLVLEKARSRDDRGRTA